jgi:UDP-N-acetylglucosamine 2-epimerase (non-hydrolysing)
VKNLLAEGQSPDRIHFVGNVMIDTLLKFRPKAARSDILERLGLKSRGYAVVTLHRPSNVDDPARLAGLMGMLAELSRRLTIVFPVHPRTRQYLESAGSPAGLMLLPPMGYLEFLRLTGEARLVLTDSGGIQEETTILQVPCLTLRENTERPVTIEQGTNRLVGVEPGAILRAALEELEGPPKAAQVPDLWDGGASRRILDVLRQRMTAA